MRHRDSLFNRSIEALAPDGSPLASLRVLGYNRAELRLGTRPCFFDWDLKRPTITTHDGDCVAQIVPVWKDSETKDHYVGRTYVTLREDPLDRLALGFIVGWTVANWEARR